jgi:hypothetical protein
MALRVQTGRHVMLGLDIVFDQQDFHGGGKPVSKFRGAGHVIILCRE